MTVRQTIELEYGGMTLSIHNWAKLRGIRRNAIRQRLKKGLPMAVVLGFEPVKRNTPPVHKPMTRTNQPAEELKAITKPVEVIDSEAVGREAKRIRRACGVTQDDAAKDMRLKAYRLLECGRMKWTAELVAKFNAVAKTWFVETSKAD